jgi:predicted ATPase
MLRSADEVLALSNAQGLPFSFAVGNVVRGWCRGALGQTAEGILDVLQGMATWRATGANSLVPLFLTMLAELHGKAAQPKEGLTRLAEATALVETTQERWAEAEMHRVRGTLLLSINEQVVAEHSFHRALSVARRQSAKFWELRAALDLARFLG